MDSPGRPESDRTLPDRSSSRELPEPGAPGLAVAAAPHIPALATVALAGVLRLTHLAFLAARDPLFLHPVVDSWYHSKEAQAILTLGPTLPGAGAFYKPPLYSYLLALLYALFGTGAGAVVARLVSIVCGCAAVYFAVRIAVRLGGARAGWIAGLAVAVYGTAILSDTQILQISIVNALALAACDRLVASRESGSPARVLVTAGILLGLLAVTRTDGLIATAFACVWAAWPRGRSQFDPALHFPRAGAGGPSSSRVTVARPVSVKPSAAGASRPRLSSFRAGACVLAPALLVVAPVTFRNALLEHDPVLISWNGGINLFIGNDPGFDQSSGNWHADLAWMRVYNAPGDLGLSRGADHQAFFLDQTIQRTLAEPLATLRTLGGKTSLLLSDYEISNNQRISEARSYSPLLALLMPQWRWFALPFGLAGPLIAAGLVLAWGRLDGRGRPVVLIAAAWALVSVAFFNTERYRLPVILLLIPVAAAGWSRVRETFRTRLAIAGGAALAVAINGSLSIPARTTLPLSATLDLADVADLGGDLTEAFRLRERAVQEDPDDLFARVRLGDTLRRLKRYAEAKDQYAAVLARSEPATDWHNAATRSTARCYFGLRRYGDAANWYRTFLEAGPDRPYTGTRPDFHLRGTPPLQACWIRLELSDALVRDGRRDDAAAEIGRVTRDCAASPKLLEQAAGRMQGLARAAPESRPPG